MNLAVCNDLAILELMIIVNTIIDLIKLLIPVIIIVIASVDVLKSVIGNDEKAIKSAQSKIPKRLMAAMVMYLIPTIVDVGVTLVDKNFEYAACFSNASKGNVEQMKLNIAREKITSIYAIIDTGDYKPNDIRYEVDQAGILVTKLEPGTVRDQLKDNLNEIDNIAKNKALKDFLEVFPPLGIFVNPDKEENKPGSTTKPGSGELPYYNQCDEPWANKTFYTGTYCAQSCGATSLAMVAAGIGTNSSVVPTTIGDKMHEFGLPATFVTHDAFTNANFLKSFGIKGERINTGSNKTETLNVFTEKLKAGKPIIINVPGHYVVIDHILNGAFHMLDPGNRNKNVYYTNDELWEEITNYKGRGNPLYAYFFFEKAA